MWRRDQPEAGNTRRRSAGSQSGEEPCSFHDYAGHTALSQEFAPSRFGFDCKLDPPALVLYQVRPHDNDFADRARCSMPHLNRYANRRDARRQVTIEHHHRCCLEPRDQPRGGEHDNIATAQRLGGIVGADDTFNLGAQSDE